MTIRMQGWAEGATPPTNIDTAASYTDFDVLTCEATEILKTYRTIDGTQTLGGTNAAWNRVYLRVLINFGPRILADATLRASAIAMVRNTYFRVKDARHTLLGNANTVVFVNPNGWNPERGDATYLSWNGKLELISQGVV